jgi:hypothetical protein
MPIRTHNRYLNPLLWAIVGWGAAVIGNVVATDLAHHYWSMLIHLDELGIGFLFGALRWAHTEWRIEQVYATRKMEIKVHDALTILQYGKDDDARARAIAAIVDALDEHRPIHQQYLETTKPS